MTAVSALGHKLPRHAQIGVSALPPKAAATFTDRRGSQGPADISAQRVHGCLTRLYTFDNFFGALHLGPCNLDGGKSNRA